MDYSPPPLFKQGASARAKVVFFSLIALILLVADSRLRSLTMIRQGVATVLYPLQVVALLPRDAAYMVGDYFSSLTVVKRENNKLKQQQVANALALQQVQQLAAENAQLRKLLEANARLPVKSVMSEILYDARDAFTRKVVLDRGTQHGVARGQPVIDDTGVVGQVTRVFPFTSEVTLLTDKEQAIPVQVLRSGLRSIAYGQGHSGALDLRFMPANADIKNGDVLVTSGIDGVYPAGLAVAKVVQVESKSSDAFARIVCQPLAGIDRNRQLLILLTESEFPPRPALEDLKDKSGKKHGENGTDPGKEPPKEPAKDVLTTSAQPAAQSGHTPPAAPEQKAAAPEQKAAAPEQKTPATDTKTAAPAQKVAMPEQKVPAPVQNAPVATPKLAAPVVKPAAPVQAPVQKAITPETKAAMPAPVQKTPIPEQKTTTP